MKKIIRRLLWTLFFLFLGLNLIAFFHAYRLTHFENTEAARTKADEKRSFADKLKLAFLGVSNPRPVNQVLPDTSFETIRIKSNKEIECWLIKRPDAKGTVLLFHGYGGSKSTLLDKAEVFRQLGYNTLLADFMGSGGSEGTQTTIGYMEAEQVKDCYDHVRKLDQKPVILFGTSMGAAAIMKAMSDQDLGADCIIIECPFSTMLQTVRNRFVNLGIPAFPLADILVFWGGVQNGFNAYEHNPVQYAKNITRPTLLLYGDLDKKVTLEETISIYRNLKGKKQLVRFPGAAHENYLSKYREDWTRHVKHFLQTLTAKDTALAVPEYR